MICESQALMMTHRLKWKILTYLYQKDAVCVEWVSIIKMSNYFLSLFRHLLDYNYQKKIWVSGEEITYAIELRILLQWLQFIEFEAMVLLALVDVS